MKAKKWRHFGREKTTHGDAPTPRAQAHVAAPSPPLRRVAPFNLRARRRGVVLDLTVVAFNLFLVPPLARLLRSGGQAFLVPEGVGGGRVSRGVGWLLLSVFAAHAIGAFFKRLPRQARSAGLANGSTRAGSPPRTPSLEDIRAREARRGLRRLAPRLAPNKLLTFAACALLLFHFAIFLMLLSAGWQGAGLEGWVSIFGEGGVGGASSFVAYLVRFVLVCFVLPLPTFLVAISLGGGGGTNGGGDAPARSWRTHWATELFADFLLYFSIVVITVAMNVVVAPRFASVGGVERSLADVLASLIPLALAFSIIYLPPRLIYLAEDYRSPLTWLTILVALLALAYRTFFPGDVYSW